MHESMSIASAGVGMSATLSAVVPIATSFTTL